MISLGELKHLSGVSVVLLLTVWVELLAGSLSVEAGGDWAPTAYPNFYLIGQGADNFEVDVLANDVDIDIRSNNAITTVLYLEDDSQITGLDGDPGARLSVNPAARGTNGYGGDTEGSVVIDPSDDYVGEIRFNYEMCDAPRAAPEAECSTAFVSALVVPPDSPAQAANDYLDVPDNLDSFVVDVLSNDYDFNHYTTEQISTRALYLENDSQITNVAGDPGATVTVDAGFGATNQNASHSPFRSEPFREAATYGAVVVDPTDGFLGTLTFDYQVCDEPVATAGPDSCTVDTARIEVTNAPDAVNDLVTGVEQGDGSFTIDVLDNDFDDDHFLGYGSGYSTYYYGDLYVVQDSITNVTGDLGAVITVVNRGVQGTNETAMRKSGFNTYGEVQVEPSDNFAGTLTFDYEVCDARERTNNLIPGCSTATVTVEVQGNEPPVAEDFAVELYAENGNGVDYVFAGEFLSNYSDAEGDGADEVIITSLPTGGALLFNGRVISAGERRSINLFEDDLEYLAGTSFCGADSFTWQASDVNGVLSNEATVTLNDNATQPTSPPGCDSVPVIANFTRAVSEDGVRGFDLSTFETVNGLPLNSLEALRVESLPQFGRLTLAGVDVAAGTVIEREDVVGLRYTPNPNYNGPDGFEYNVRNARGYATNAATLNTPVTAVNDAPEVRDFTQTTPYETTLSFTPEAGVNLFAQHFSDVDTLTTDAEFESWSLASVIINTLPTKGTLQIPTQPERVIGFDEVLNVAEFTELVYVPNAGESGVDSFTWAGDDGYVLPVGEEEATLRPQQTSPGLATATITILEPQEQPAVVNIARAIDFGAEYVFQPEDLGVGTAAEQFIQFDPAGLMGDLLYNGQPYAGELIPRADLATVRFVPEMGFSGETNLVYIVVAEGVTLGQARVTIVVGEAAAEVVPETEVEAEAPVLREDQPSLIRTGAVNREMRNPFLAWLILLGTYSWGRVRRIWHKKESESAESS